MQKKVYTAIGLMSGTSLDGIDAALIETDGYDYVRPIGFMSEPYKPELRAALRNCFGKKELAESDYEAERNMTLQHADIIKNVLEKYKYETNCIGFHGQTILHDIGHKLTIQIGDAKLLAEETGIDVVYDFRIADVAAGGQGAPLVPLYHKALVKAQDLELPVALVNIGGVANITWIGEEDNHLIAFDTGTGNALMDDYVKTHFGLDFDENGAIASRGNIQPSILADWMKHDYFVQKPPKSLDRNEWDIAAMGPLAEDLKGLNYEDTLATLLAFTVEGIAAGLNHVPQIPRAIYLCGGGRHNKTLVAALKKRVPCDIKMVDDLGWNGDATEAECFAYLAVRSILGLPISLPSTTGVSKPLTGGRLQKA